MEKTGCEITCGGPTTLAVKGWMIMIINQLTSLKSPSFLFLILFVFVFAMVCFLYFSFHSDENYNQYLLLN